MTDDQIKKIVSGLKFNSEGLIPVVAQDARDGEVLMVAYMSKESLVLSLRTGTATYWSRSRQTLWKKGESSGHVQKIHAVLKDCDNDTLLIKIEQVGGAACHTGHRSCFYSRCNEEGAWDEVSSPVFDPKKVYKK